MLSFFRLSSAKDSRNGLPGSLAAGLAWAAAAGASLAGEVSDLAKEEQELNSPRTTEEAAAAPRRTARALHGKINSEKIGRHRQEEKREQWERGRGWVVFGGREPCSSCISFQRAGPNN